MHYLEVDLTISEEWGEFQALDLGEQRTRDWIYTD